jgi:CBS domain-containing protein
MLARDAMIPNPLTLAPTATLLELILAVLGGNQTTAAVVEAGRLVGMVSVEDVFRALLPAYAAMGRMPNLADVLHDTYFEEAFEKFKNTAVGSVMCREIDSITPEEPLMNAVALFVRKARKTLPVLDGGKFIGTVTRRSVLAAATRKAQR